MTSKQPEAKQPEAKQPETKRPETGQREIDFRWSLPLLVIVLFAITAVAWAFVQERIYTSTYKEQYLSSWRANMQRFQQTVESAFEARQFVGTDGQIAHLDEQITKFNDDPGLDQLAIVTRDGRILYSNRLGQKGRVAAEVLTGFDAAQLDVIGSATGPGQVFEAEDVDWTYIYYPLSISEEKASLRPDVDAILFVKLDVAHRKPVVYALLRNGLMLFVVIGVINIGILIWFLNQFLSKPLQKIIGGVESFSRNDATDDDETDIVIPGRGQFAYLADAFNTMRHDLSKTLAHSYDHQQRLSRILESIGDAVIVTDKAGRIERMNGVAEVLTGWDRDTARDKPINEVMLLEDSETGELAASLVTDAVQTGDSPRRISATLRSKSGQYYQIGEGASPLIGITGALEGAVLTFRDITVDYRIREERILAELAFETGGPQMIADAGQIIVRANRACFSLSGYATEELIGVPLASLYEEQADTGFIDFLNGNYCTMDVYPGRTERVNKKGEHLHFFESIRLLRNQQGVPSYFIVNLQDFTSVETAVDAMQETRSTYQSLVDSMYDGFMVVGDEGIVECNEQLARILQRDRAEVIGLTILDLSPEFQDDGVSSKAKLGDVLRTTLTDRQGMQLDWQARLANGERLDLEVSLAPGTVSGEQVVLINVRDITARKRGERERERLMNELAAKEKMIRLSSQAYGIASWEMDVNTRRLRWSEGSAEVLGVNVANLGSEFGKLPFVYEEDQSLIMMTVERALAEGKGFKLESRHIRDDGEVRWGNAQCEVETDATGAVTALRGAVADITDYKTAQSEVERLAYYDPLTGLANRRLVQDRLQQACYLAARGQTSGALLFIDLDRFKLLNDSLGHKIGDLLLTGVADRLREWTREEDTVGRLGGDEFIVILPSVGTHSSSAAQNAHRVADKLQQRLSGNYEVDGHSYHITASVGIAVFPQDGARAEDLLHHADAAMYLAKKQGRDTVAFYQPRLQEEADARLELEQDLRLAVEKNQLELYYQPKVTRATGVLGSEALLRWHHPVRGIVSPAEFIPVAEETGLIIEIGGWVTNEACRQLAAWNRTRGDKPLLGVSINASPIQFRHQGFVDSVKQAITRHVVDPALITLEITEGTLIENIDDTIAKLYELKVVGVDTSIDDFGTGYSSLYYLKNLPLDEIKIDQTYVRDITVNPNDAAIVATIMSIGKHFGLRAVAEGVETEAQAEYLRSIGCDCHQGYLYSRPLPAAEFEKRYV
mgnify:FL=1